MAFKITKTEEKRIDEIVARLSSKFDDINAILDKAKAEIEDELAEYNEIREELRGVIEDIHSEKTSEYDDKSDNWRDGDRGSATYDWLDSLQSIVIEVEDDLTIPADEWEIEKPDYIETLSDEGLPSEPEY